MKRIFCVMILLALAAAPSLAQKYAFVDTEYILSKIPSYRSAQEELERLSKQYQQEVEQGYSDLDKMLKDFQAEQVLLTPEVKQKRQEQILAEESRVNDLKQKYFGREGLLYQKQEELLKPIQDQVFQAVRELAQAGSYAAIFDTAASESILYSSPRHDKSDEILQKLGFN